MTHVTADDAFLSGGGEMGALVRALDWSVSPLGPTALWPQSLRTAISLCLMSRFPMAVCWGPAYAIVYNDAYRYILGTKHPWAMGRPCFEVWSELAYIVKPMFDSVIETGEATWSDDLMLPMLRHGYLEEAYFTVSYSAVRGESERPEGILVTVTETTERYLAERRLQLVRELGDASGSARSLEQASELARSNLARHHADVPFSLLYMLDAAAGEARLAGATGVQPGEPAAPLRVPLADRDARPWPLGRVLPSPEHVVVETDPAIGPLPGGIWPEPSASAVLLPIPRPGHPEPLAVLVAGVNPRRALDGPHVEFFHLVARQIANAMANAIAHEESRRRADALAEIDRAKTAFFSNVSHEFRTPLTLMLGSLQDVLGAPAALSPSDLERLEVAHRNSLRLLKLVNSLLDFSRIEAGRVQVSYEPVDLAAFTSELASVFRSAIERAGLTFTVDCSAAAGAQVFVDREMWEKVVLNLVSNAFKFTFEGEIEVSVRQAGEALELSVRDTGTGIPAEELPHLFERFHRVRNARSRSFEGTGIGLALVQELVKLHGGVVRVESEPERGSTFTVTIPLGTAHLPADRIGALRPQVSTGLRADAFVEESLRWLPDEGPGAPRPAAAPYARILVADDNADMRDYLRRLLAERYAVETVGDGEHALAAIRQRRPDLVLSDVMMPRLDGFGLLDALRRDPATQDLPVILLSARAGEEARVEGLRAGADDYLVKPFGAGELVARVGSVLELARLRHQGEARLEEANRELRRRVLEQQTLLDVLPIGIGIATDRECRDIRVNRAFAATLGLPTDANASMTAPPGERPTNFRVMTPEGKEVQADQLPMQVAASEGREMGGLELDIVHEDGRVVRLLEYAAPLFDEQGTPRGAVGAFVDVTASHHAKRTLARSEERYRRIFDTAGVSIWEEDFSAVKQEIDRLRGEGVDDLERYLKDHPDLVDRCIELVRVVDVNRASLRMFRAVDKQDLLESLGRIFAPQTRDVFIGELLALARGERRHEAETALRTLDGRPVHALMTMTFPAPGESFESVLVSLADITDRKRAETALRRSETLFREMADTAPVMLWITDGEARCTFLSRSWYEFTGQTAATGLGAGWMDAVHPDDRNDAATRFLAAHTGREPFRHEYRLRRDDGEYRWAIDAARPRFDEAGRYLGYIGAVIDITERKEAETALQQEVAVRTVLAQVGASIAGELKSDRLVQAVTDAATTLTGAEIGAFVHTAHDEHRQAYTLASGSGAATHSFAGFLHAHAGEGFGPALRGEAIIRLDDVSNDPRFGGAAAIRDAPYGPSLLRSCLAVPVVARGGQVLGGLVFGHSQLGAFTTRHEQLATGVASWAAIALDNARLYRDLEEANRLKDEFLATLSHELRTPLNAVLGWAHMLRSGAMEPEIQRRALESLERNARAQAQLVEDLLDVSRIVSGKLHMRPAVVDVATIIANAIDTVRAGAAAKRLGLEVHVEDGERILVTGDPDRLQQIVWNLASNAIKFTPAGGRIDVELRRVDSKAEIVVRDTGQGIAPSFRPHVFERFRQMDASTARRHGGLGLGLSIVRHLTEAHGGTVEAESAGEGQGATFRVRLPIRAVDEHGEPPPRKAGRRQPALAAVRALVVDDEPDARELIRYVLEARGASVMTAASAGEALHLVDQHPFDVLIADIGMPEQDGHSLMRALRGLSPDAQGVMPAIAVTAYASVRDRAQALEAGYNWHLAKPVDPDQLVAAVSAAVTRDIAPAGPRVRRSGRTKRARRQ